MRFSIQTHPETLLAIAGFDPSSGAGITADLATFAAHGFFGTSAITALTVQSTVGVESTHPVDSGILRATLACLAGDLPPAGTKLGMLGTAENVHAVADFLLSMRSCQVVLDPVLVSTSGRALLSEDGLRALRERLLPLVRWVTPNRAELARLTGMPASTPEQCVAASESLLAEFPGLCVVATGGDSASVTDMVHMPGAEATWMHGTRLESEATHGTGCAFASALLCALVRGQQGIDAVGSAKHYVTEAIRTAAPRGRGKGPMNLLWPLG